MDGHGAFVVGDKYSALLRGHFEHSVVWQPLEAGIVRGFEIDGRLTPTDALDDTVIEIGVREESDAHDPDFRNSSLAR